MHSSNNPENAQAKSLIVNYLVIILLLSLLWLLYEGVSGAFLLCAHAFRAGRSITGPVRARDTVPDSSTPTNSAHYMLYHVFYFMLNNLLPDLIAMTGVLESDTVASIQHSHPNHKFFDPVGFKSRY